MPGFSWKGGTGEWGTATLWTPEGVPATSSDTATIAVAGPYTVTIAQATSFAPAGVVLSGTEAVLAVDGTIDTGGGTIALNDGTLSLGPTGRIANAVFTLSGGTFAAMGGTVADATMRGPLVLADAATLSVAGTLALLDASGAAPGTIDMAGLGSTLQVVNSLTLDAALLSVGGANTAIAIDPAATLTLGNSLSATFSASFAEIAGELVNNGTIGSSGGGVTRITGLHNGGLLDLADGQVWIGGTTLENTGTIRIGAGGNLLVEPDVTIGNAGTFSLDTDGTLSLGGSYTLPQVEAIGVIANGGTLLLDGTLDLGGGTLAGDGLFANMVLGSGGTISNGTIAPAAGTLVGAGGVLDRVTWLGNLNLADSGFSATGGLTVADPAGGTIALGGFSLLQIAGGLTLGAGGSIAMDGDLSILRFVQDQTLDGADVSMSGATASFQVDAGTLTIGTATTLHLSGDGLALQGAFVNQGRIDLTAGSAAIGDFVDPAGFANQGTIAVTGGRLVLNDTSFTNSGLIDIGAGGVVSVDTTDRFFNPGTIIVNTGGTLELLDSMTLADLVNGNLEGAGGTLVVGGPLDLQTGTMDIELTPASSVIDLIAGGTIQNGTIHVSGGPFLTSGGTLESIIHEGTLVVTSFGSLAVQGGLTLTGVDGTGPGAVVVDDGATLSLRDSVAMGGGTIAMSGSLSDLAFDQDTGLADLTVAVSGSSAEIDVSSGTLTLGTTVVLSLATDFGFGYGNLLNQGSISLTFGSFTVDDWVPGDSFVNDGGLDVRNGRFTVATDIFSNAGTVAIGAGGVLSVESTSSFDSTGVVSIGTSGTLDIGGASGASVAFAGAGLLVLDDAGGYTGTIGGLSIGTAIQLTGQTVLSASITGTTLTALFDGGGSVAYTVDPALPGLTVDIETGDDGQQDLLRILCFRAGTRLQTEAGPRVVEDLRPGDMVRTATGADRPVKWIGRRTVDTRRHPDPAAILPVRIDAGTFGPSRPARPLYLSPDHAIHVDGVLVPVRHLLNGSTIRQVRVASVTYFHVELDRHDIVIAEGLEAESYLDTGDRDCFDGGAVLRLHPVFGHDASLAREALGYAPVVVAGPVVENLRFRLRNPARQRA